MCQVYYCPSKRILPILREFVEQREREVDVIRAERGTANAALALARAALSEERALRERDATEIMRLQGELAEARAAIAVAEAELKGLKWWLAKTNAPAEQPARETPPVTGAQIRNETNHRPERHVFVGHIYVGGGCCAFIDPSLCHRCGKPASDPAVHYKECPDCGSSDKPGFPVYSEGYCKNPVHARVVQIGEYATGTNATPPAPSQDAGMAHTRFVGEFYAANPNLTIQAEQAAARLKDQDALLLECERVLQSLSADSSEWGNVTIEAIQSTTSCLLAKLRARREGAVPPSREGE